MTLLLAITIALQPAQATIVDRVVVEVGEQLVMQSDVAFETALTEALADGEKRRRARLGEAAPPVSPTPFWTRGDAIQRLVDMAVIRQFAGESKLYQAREEDVKARLDQIGFFDDPRFWEQFMTQWSMDATGLRRILKRRILIDRYLRRNIQGEPGSPEWEADSEELLASLRTRTRIRMIQPEAPPPPERPSQ